ncbi:MAG TPA: efflux RND transporter periplasmic adaptor subunit [Planctomycetes bacterium]|nr:efflux RND transporter periplasmic adaptor subunit [Planctomycetota bacterium]
MKILRRILVYLVIVAAVGGAVVAAKKIKKQKMAEVASLPRPEAHPWAVRVATVKRADIVESYPALARVTSLATSQVSGQISGTILEMGPREGVSVKAGDLLARIDTREIDDQIRALKADLEAAKADAAHAQNEWERENHLLEVGGSTASRVEAMRTAAVAAQKKVESLRKRISALEVRKGYALVRAPADGVIAKRLAEPGDICMPGHPLYSITQSQGARVSVRLPQDVLAQVVPGGTIVLTDGKHRLEAAITRIHPALDARAMGTVEADLPESPFGLPSDARVRAAVILDRIEGALVAPELAFLHQGEQDHDVVYRVEGDDDDLHVKVTHVLIRLKSPEGVAFEGVAKEGDRLVVGHLSDLARLVDGDPVRVVEGR